MNQNAYKEWLSLPDDEKLTIFSNIAQKNRVSDEAIEKDYWVSVVLNTISSQKYGKAFVFKGGTSLSKGWNLIERFSEDIDLAIDRGFLNFSDDLNKSQRTKRRKESKIFIETVLAEDLKKTIKEFGLGDICRVEVPEDNVSDRDPVVLFVHYDSLYDDSATGEYMANVVKIEVSCRSMLEPFQPMDMRSMVADAYPSEAFAESPISVPTVMPGRTFLEKVFLLHEEFNRPNGCSNLERLTRHMYDIEKMMDLSFAQEAMNNAELYRDIVNHRQAFTRWSGLDYGTHSPATISFVPPKDVLGLLMDDYSKMQEHFIYGQSLPFEGLVKRLETLQDRFRQLPFVL